MPGQSAMAGRVEASPAIGYCFCSKFPERQWSMSRSRVACSLALAVLGLGVSAASAQNVRSMGSLVQEPTTMPAETPPPEAEPKSSRPGPNEGREAPPTSGAPAATVMFGSNSADISAAGKADLDRVA